MSRLRQLLVRTGLFPLARAVRRAFRGPADRAREREEVDFYRAVLPPGALAFDIGANVGEITERLLQAGARVVAVEPQAECVAELRARCGAHTRLVGVVTAAVGRESGTATLHVRESRASSSLDPLWYGKPGEPRTVPMVTLAELIARHGVPDFCKVDVEGSELEVFSTLAQPLPLVCFEYVDFALDRAAACLALLAPDGEAETNLGLTGPHRFLLPGWIPPAELLRRLPGWMADGTARPWGDIWVRRIAPP